MENDVVEIDFRTILNLLRKNIIFIILLTVFGAASAFFISYFLIVPQFEASMTLSVTTREDQAIAVASDQITAARQLVNTYAVILTNDSLLDEVIQTLRLNDTITSLSRRISASPVNQTQVMQMTMRDSNPNTAKAVLEIILYQAEELLTTTVRAGSVEVVSPPRIDFNPVSPRIYMNVAIGAALGLLLALAFVFIRKALHNTFISDEDVTKQLGLPVLGVIPSLKLKDGKNV